MSLLNTVSSADEATRCRSVYQHPTPPPPVTTTLPTSAKKTSLDFLLNHDASSEVSVVFSPPSPPATLTILSSAHASSEEEAAAVLGSLRYSFAPVSPTSSSTFAVPQNQPDTPPTSPIHTTFTIPASPTPSASSTSDDSGTPPPQPQPHHLRPIAPTTQPPAPPATTPPPATTTRMAKIYTCTWSDCTKTFRTSHSLRSHMRCHGEPQFPCTVCGAPFRRKHDLHRHGRSLHQAGNPHECRWCLKTFPRADALRRHINSRSPTHGCHVARVAAARSAVEADEARAKEGEVEMEE
ncbi:hypothetical protein HDU67_000393 [Dinochytrium kinnereticum]|nr:hypothetical protein HDU67_000393 [Dinochytrium kinnereticum]